MAKATENANGQTKAKAKKVGTTTEAKDKAGKQTRPALTQNELHAEKLYGKG